MGRLVLHIGLHKTGTSAFQHVMHRNRRLLRVAGVDYPTARDAAGKALPKHNDLFSAIAHEVDHGGAACPVLGPSAARVERLAERVARARGVVVISAEGLSGSSPRYAEAFAPLRGLDVRVVAAFRPHADWAVAFHGQMVRSREVREARPFAEWLASDDVRARLDYGALLARWDAVLGPVGAVRYESGDMVAPILRNAGLPPWIARLPGARRRANPSLTWAAREALRAQNAAERGASFTPDPVGGFADRGQREAFTAAHAGDWARIAARAA